MSTDNNDPGMTPLATDPAIYDRVGMHKDAVRGFEENAKTGALMTPEAAKQHVESSWLPVIRRYDLTSAETGALANLDRVSYGKAPDAATRAEWAGEAKAALLSTYGPDRVGQALQDARAWVAQDPQLRKFQLKGFGDHKSLVLLAARLGGEARKAGRLKS